MPGSLEFISMLFLTFEKGIRKKLCQCFEIHKYAFFNIWKGDKKKTVPGILRLASMFFLIFEKGITKKPFPGIFDFASMVF